MVGTVLAGRQPALNAKARSFMSVFPIFVLFACGMYQHHYWDTPGKSGADCVKWSALSGLTSQVCSFNKTISRTTPYTICLHDPREDQYVSAVIAQGAPFDDHVAATLVKVLRSSGDEPVYVDVGGNIGYFTLMAASLGAKTVTFEPLLANFALLSRSLQLNNFRKSKLIFAGLGADSSLIDLYKWQGNFGSTFGAVKNDPRLKVDDVTYQGSALTARLDVVLAEYPVIDFMKVDCEGCEGLALLGAGELISRNKIRTLIIEVQPSSWNDYEALKWFERSGYLVFLVKTNPTSYESVSWSKIYKVLSDKSTLVVELVITLQAALFSA